MISVCKNASRYHSVPGMWKLKSQGQKKEIIFFDRHPPPISESSLLSIDVATFI